MSLKSRCSFGESSNNTIVQYEENFTGTILIEDTVINESKIGEVRFKVN
jgi:hypothetical protein